MGRWVACLWCLCYDCSRHALVNPLVFLVGLRAWVVIRRSMSVKMLDKKKSGHVHHGLQETLRSSLPLFTRSNAPVFFSSCHSAGSIHSSPTPLIGAWTLRASRSTNTRMTVSDSSHKHQIRVAVQLIWLLHVARSIDLVSPKLATYAQNVVCRTVLRRHSFSPVRVSLVICMVALLHVSSVTLKIL